jgi:hypothetical protein
MTPLAYTNLPGRAHVVFRSGQQLREERDAILWYTQRETSRGHDQGLYAVRLRQPDGHRPSGHNRSDQGYLPGQPTWRAFTFTAMSHTPLVPTPNWTGAA